MYLLIPIYVWRPWTQKNIVKHDEDEDGKLPCHLIGTKRAASPWRKPGDVLEMCARQDVRSWTFLASKLSSGSLMCLEEVPH